MSSPADGHTNSLTPNTKRDQGNLVQTILELTAQVAALRSEVKNLDEKFERSLRDKLELYAPAKWVGDTMRDMKDLVDQTRRDQIDNNKRMDKAFELIEGVMTRMDHRDEERREEERQKLKDQLERRSFKYLLSEGASYSIKGMAVAGGFVFVWKLATVFLPSIASALEGVLHAAK